MLLWHCNHCQKTFKEFEIERWLGQPVCPDCLSASLSHDGWEVSATWEQEAQAASQESDLPSGL